MNVIIEYNNNETDIITNVLFCAAQHFELPEKIEVSVSILTDDEIKELNARTRGKDEVTDVLSFPYIEINDAQIVIENHKEDINPYTKCLMLGDICINADRVQSQAESFGHSTEREYAYLALHGFLHILGFHHYTPSDKEEMRRHEEAVLGKINLTR